MIRADGTARRCVSHLPAQLSGSGLAWAPGRHLLAVLISAGDYSLRGGYVVDVSTGRRTRGLGPAVATAAFGPSWSRDGTSLAFVSRAHRIFIVRSDGGDGHYLDLWPQR